MAYATTNPCTGEVFKDISDRSDTEVGPALDKLTIKMGKSFAEAKAEVEVSAARLPSNLDFAAVAPILCAGVMTYKG